MSSPDLAVAPVDAAPGGGPAAGAGAEAAPGGIGEVRRSIRAMATDVSVRVPSGRPPARRGRSGVGQAESAVDEALEVFRRVEVACTRFDPASPLMRANARPTAFHRLPRECFEAVRLAHRAYETTHGRFDPRVLRDLLQLGYDRTVDFASGQVRLDGPPRTTARRALGPWRPRFRGAPGEVQLGEHPIDLGGIGKGLAVEWAARALARRGVGHFLVEAGGDCRCGGSPAEGGPWRVGVEDPAGSADPVAVLELSDLACTTSSVRVRTWTVGGRRVHHLIDPRTGLPGGDGVLAVTVVGPHAAFAEVWSKALLVAGSGEIARLAERKSLAALWVGADGSLRHSRAMGRHLAWARAENAAT